MSTRAGGGLPPRVVVVSAHLPSARAREAGQRLVQAQLAALASLTKVSLLSFANAREQSDIDESLTTLADRIKIVPVTQASRMRGILARPLWPAFAAIRSSAVMRRLVAEEFSNEPGAVLWAEYTQMAQYIDTMPAARVGHSVVVCHDVVSQRMERRASTSRGLIRPLMQLEGRRVSAWEASGLRRAGVCVAYSRKDQQLLADLGVTRVELGYPPLGRRKSMADTMRSAEPSIVFFGAMNRRENEDACVHFLDAVWPHVRSAIPGCTFQIIGANPSAIVQRRAESTAGVAVTGYVERPEALLQRGWLAVAPLREGAGVKIKVLECLGAGTAVVATPVGAEGIDAAESDGLIVSSNDAAMVAQLVTLLGDRARCDTLGASAAQWVDRDYRPRELDATRIASILRTL